LSECHNNLERAFPGDELLAVKEKGHSVTSEGPHSAAVIESAASRSSVGIT
jgi:hypothetical protein